MCVCILTTCSHTRVYVCDVHKSWHLLPSLLLLFSISLLSLVKGDLIVPLFGQKNKANGKEKKRKIIATEEDEEDEEDEDKMKKMNRTKKKIAHPLFTAAFPLMLLFSFLEFPLISPSAWRLVVGRCASIFLYTFFLCPFKVYPFWTKCNVYI